MDGDQGCCVMKPCAACRMDSSAPLKLKTTAWGRGGEWTRLRAISSMEAMLAASSEAAGEPRAESKCADTRNDTARLSIDGGSSAPR